VKLNATVNDYVGRSSEEHYTVVWVTTESGTFIRTLWEQGPSLGDDEWEDHCKKFWDAKSGDNTVDGFSGATAWDYTSTANNPIDPVWDCRNKSGALVADGNNKFWIQYAEDRSAQGPYTTNGLLWTKGPVASAPTYANQGANFTNMSVTWTPDPVAPTITSAAPSATGTVGVPYNHECTATGTAPITFSATGLPSGLEINSTGVISGIPVEAGLFNGTITAANGTTPDATLAFSIDIIEVPVVFAAVQVQGGNFSMTGAGPANGIYTVISATDLFLPLASWTEVTTGTFNGAGQFLVSLPFDSEVPKLFYRLRIP
jgi:hypothetical protein